MSSLIEKRRWKAVPAYDLPGKWWGYVRHATPSGIGYWKGMPGNFDSKAAAIDAAKQAWRAENEL